MPVLAVADIQGGPCRVPVKGNVFRRAVASISFLERVEVDDTGVGVAEETESDLVLGIGLC
jgi:hypothetical protein